jgi:hypothetical protein
MPRLIPMKKEAVINVVAKLHQASDPGKTKDGSRIYVRYRKFTEDSHKAVEEREPARDLKIKEDRYTGRLDRIYEATNGDTILTMLVELERSNKYRSFNLDKGDVIAIAVLGD